jgi:hypothetical protein
MMGVVSETTSPVALDAAGVLSQSATKLSAALPSTVGPRIKKHANMTVRS